MSLNLDPPTAAEVTCAHHNAVVDPNPGLPACQPWATVLALSRNFKIPTVNYPESNKIKKYYHILPLENHRAHSKILEMYQGYVSPQNSLPVSLTFGHWLVPPHWGLTLFPLFLTNTLLKLQFHFLLSFLQVSLHRLRSLFMVGRVSTGAASLWTLISAA